MKDYEVYFNPNFAEDGVKMMKDSDFIPKLTEDWDFFIGYESTEYSSLEDVFEWGQDNVNLPRSISVGDIIVMTQGDFPKKNVEGCFLVSPEGFKSIKFDLD